MEKMTIEELKKEIVEIGMKLLKDGHVIGSAGNISVRVKDDDKEIDHQGQRSIVDEQSDFYGIINSRYKFADLHRIEKLLR